MKRLLLLVLLTLLLVLPLVNSAPPFPQTVTGPEYYTIAYPQYQYIQVDSNLNLSIHVINATKIITGGTTNCWLDLYNSQGTELMHNMLTAGISDYSISINKGNFSTQGQNSFIIVCNSSTQTGIVFGVYEINNNGQEFTQTKLLIYALSLIFMVLLIIALLFIINKLPDSNAIDEKGNIMQISWLKYFRPVLYIIIYGISLAILFLLSNIALAHLMTPMLGNILFAFYKIAFWFMICALPIYSIWILVRAFQDKEMKRLIERRVEIKSTP